MSLIDFLFGTRGSCGRPEDKARTAEIEARKLERVYRGTAPIAKVDREMEWPPPPPKVGSNAVMPSKRFEETQLVAVKGIGVTVPQYRCCTCNHEFEYDNMNSPDEETPKFCPNCGRRNA